MTAWLPLALLAPLSFALLLAGLSRAAIAALGMLVLLAMPAVPDWLLTLLREPASVPTGAAQAVVIVAAPGSVGEDGGAPTLLLLRTGAELARQSGLPVLVAGQKSTRAGFADAQVMAATLQRDFHTDVRWVVADGGDPWRATADMAAALHPAAVERVFLVTTSWDRSLSTTLLRRAGIASMRPPTPAHRASAVKPVDFVPYAGALVDSADALRALTQRAWNRVLPARN